MNHTGLREGEAPLKAASSGASARMPVLSGWVAGRPDIRRFCPVFPTCQNGRVVLVSFVASHRNRDLALLEQLSVGAESLGATVASTPKVAGAVVLPTCNRFEVYVDAEDAAAA